VTGVNDTSYSKRSKRWKLILLGLLVVLVVAIIVSLEIGFAPIPFQEIISVLGNQIPVLNSQINPNSFSLVNQAIIIDIRLPRILSAVIIGAGLATSGAIFQGVFKNPMADPYVLGVSAGASLGAGVAILYGAGLSFLGFPIVPTTAFICALITVFAVYNVSRMGSRVPEMTLLLSGIAVGIFELAIVTYLQTIAGDKLGPLTFWLIGSLSSTRTTWTGLLSIAPFILVGIFVTYFYSRDLNILTLGEDQAQHLGINLERLKLILLLLGAVLTGAAVAISGLIGFIGLMIPNLTRLIVGPDHRILIPASVFLGATFLVLCDGVTRFLTSPSSPQEVPVGVITAVIGVVFFLFLLRRKKRIDAF